MLHHSACTCALHAQHMSRRGLLQSGAAAIAAGGLVGPSPWLDRAQAQQAAPSGRTLLKGGTVVSVDRTIGDLPRGDVLIDGARIAAVAPNLTADGAQVIDASDMIVMPGFIDSHRHMWEGAIRNLIPDATLRDYLGPHSRQVRAELPAGRCVYRQPRQRVVARLTAA